MRSRLASEYSVSTFIPTILLFAASGNSRWWSNWLNGARPVSGLATFDLRVGLRGDVNRGQPKDEALLRDGFGFRRRDLVRLVLRDCRES